MVDYNRLIIILQKELECQKKLLEVISRERAALVAFDAEMVQSLAEEKEGILEYGKSLQEKRELALGINSPEERSNLKLEDIINQCSSPQLKNELKHLRQDLKQTTKAVKDLNEHNAQLFKQSLGLISSTLAIFRSKPDTELPTYGVNAKLNATTHDPAFGPRSKTIVREA